METGFKTETLTTNRHNYPPASQGSLPPLKFHQLPSIQLKDAHKLAPRNFPIEPPGPNRHWEKFDHNNLPNITPFTEKPIVRAPPPSETSAKLKAPKPPGKEKPQCRKTTRVISTKDTGQNETKVGPFRPDELGYSAKLVPGHIRDALCHSLRWSTSTGRAMKEACLPISKVRPPSTTLEENADIPMRRPKRYEAHPSLWQQIAPIWDKLQDRSLVGENICKIAARERIITRDPCQSRSKCPKQTDDLLSQTDKEMISKLCRDKTLSSTYVRQCPGYAGFIPQSPLIVPIAVTNTSPDLRMMTTMKASYRPMPLNGTMDFAHRGPLSRTVTLTFPYNPYNKVENRAFFRKDIEHPW